MSMSAASETGGTWTLLTGHGHVLVEITRNPEARIRDIAAVAALTERAGTPPRKDTGSDRSSPCSPQPATFRTPRNSGSSWEIVLALTGRESMEPGV
jgi:hypothetical protein